MGNNLIRSRCMRADREELEYIHVAPRHDGSSRGYRRYSPPAVAGRRPRPLLLVFPGHGLSGEEFRIFSGYGFEELPYRLGTIAPPTVLYIDDVPVFHASHPPTPSHLNLSLIDDYSFVRSIVEMEQLRGNVDSKQIFAVGFGSGGIFVLSLPVKCGDLICAIASVGALISKFSTESSCWPLPCPCLFVIGGRANSTITTPYTTYSTNTPLFIHYCTDADNFVPLEGVGAPRTRSIKGFRRCRDEEHALATIEHSSELTNHQKLMFISSLGLIASLEFVAHQNQVLPQLIPESPPLPLHPKELPLNPHKMDFYQSTFPFPTPVSSIRSFARGCPAVQAYVVKGGGHTWPGGAKRRSLYGKTSKYLPACQRIWLFFATVAENLL